MAVWCNFRRRDICLVHIDNPFPPSAGKLYGWDQRAVSSWLRGFCITWNWHHHYFPVSLGISAQACSFEASIFPWTKGSSRFIKTLQWFGLNLQWFGLKNWTPKRFQLFSFGISICQFLKWDSLFSFHMLAHSPLQIPHQVAIQLASCPLVGDTWYDLRLPSTNPQLTACILQLTNT